MAIRSLLIAALPVAHANAQGGVLLAGVADLEVWKTDSASTLLSRNGGRLGPALRLDTWGAWEPRRNVVLFAETLLESGAARGEPGTEAYVEQYGLRVSPSDAFTIEGGKIRQLVGAFSARRLSFRNPLISAPDGYPPSYPFGLRIDGSVKLVDYRLGVVTRPLAHEDYVPEATGTLRPALALGITPVVGFRLGVSATQGPYLNDELPQTLLAGQSWKHFQQRILATDAQFSRGYVESHAEMAWSGYDVPGRPANNGFTYYVESRVTVSPRVFIAGRFEHNDYPFISPLNATVWISDHSVVNDGELGAGFRFDARTLLKLSVRRDHWAPNPNPNAPHDDGYGVAFQYSRTFDVLEMLSRER